MTVPFVDFYLKSDVCGALNNPFEDLMKDGGLVENNVLMQYIYINFMEL